MKIRDFFIRLLGGITKKEHFDKIESMNQNIELNYISRSKLDYASTLLKRWNEYRESVNTLAKEVLKNNPDYFKNNSSLTSFYKTTTLEDYFFYSIKKIFLKMQKKTSLIFIKDMKEH